MSESPNELERMLERWRLVEPEAGLELRIGRALERAESEAGRRSVSDRFLLATMAAGLIAACVIVTVLTTDALNAPKNAALANRADGPTVVNTQHLLAQLTKEME